MNHRSLKAITIAVLSVAGVGLVWSQNARSQINAAPSWVPLGVSSSGDTSTAWFHEPSSRQVLACQTVPAPGSGAGGIHCIAAKLP